MKRLLAILSLILPAAAMEQNMTSKHTCRILFFDASPGAPQTLFLFDGKVAREVELPKMNFSPVYELPAGPLDLCLLLSPPKDPKQIPAESPSAHVPANLVDFYLLVTSDPENKIAPVRMQAIDAGSDKLQAGQMLWFNLTPHTIGGVVGTQRLVAKPNTRTTLDAPASAAGEYPIQLFFQILGENRVHPLCSTSWGHDPRARNIVFINLVPGSRTPRVRGFSDYRSPAATGATLAGQSAFIP